MAGFKCGFCPHLLTNVADKLSSLNKIRQTVNPLALSCNWAMAISIRIIHTLKSKLISFMLVSILRIVTPADANILFDARVAGDSAYLSER